jgi:hypothetical protein
VGDGATSSRACARTSATRSSSGRGRVARRRRPTAPSAASPAFAGLASAYLASVSFSEVCYRLGDRERAQGFLAARDERHAAGLAACGLEAARLAARGASDPAELERYERLVAESIEPRNVAGFADPAPPRLVSGRLPGAPRGFVEARPRPCGDPRLPRAAGDGPVDRPPVCLSARRA